MQPFLKYLPFAAVCLVGLAGCASDYSPNTYASNAVQYANKVEPGTVVGFRQVNISANGNIGAVTGGAAGGVLGSEYGNNALAAVGGTAVGALVGTALDHAAGDTTGWEYIVRKNSGDMLSVTQREKKPLELGQKVLVIIGPQARVIPDYSVPPEPKPEVKAEAKPDSKPEAKPSAVKVEVVLSLPPGVTAQGPNGQVVSGQVITPASSPPKPMVEAKDEPLMPQAPAPAVQTNGIQATTVSAEDGQTVIVHLPVIGAVKPSGAGLVPVSTTTAPAAEGTVTSEPEAEEKPAAATNAAPVETPAAPPAQN